MIADDAVSRRGKKTKLPRMPTPDNERRHAQQRPGWYGAERPGSGHRRAISASLYGLSAAAWALFPAWAVLFGMHDWVWLSTGILLLFSGTVQAAVAILGSPAVKRLRVCLSGLYRTARKHRWPFVPAAGVAVEIAAMLLTVRFMDPAAVDALTRLMPLVAAVWLVRALPGRFHMSARAGAGLSTACAGAGLVIWSASAGNVSAGWRILAGAALAGFAVVGGAVKHTTELSFVAAVSSRASRVGEWSVRDDVALGVAALGLRNMVAGAALTGTAVVFVGGMPASVWVGTVLFGLIAAPIGVAAGRAAVLVDGDLGLWAISSLGAPAALCWTWLLLGDVDVGNVWVLAAGAVAVAAGNALVRQPTSRTAAAPHRSR